MSFYAAQGYNSEGTNYKVHKAECPLLCVDKGQAVLLPMDPHKIVVFPRKFDLRVMLYFHGLEMKIVFNKMGLSCAKLILS